VGGGAGGGDAALRRADEGDHFPDHVDVAQLRLETGQGVGDGQALAVDDVEGLADGVDLGGAQPGAAQADDVDAADDVDPLDDDERRDVLGGGRDAAEQGEPADGDELVDGTVARQVDVVGQGAVAGHQGAVGQDAVAADPAVVGDVAVGHEEVVVADAGRAGV